MLKELLGKCPVTNLKNTKFHLFEKTEMKWMLATLDGFLAYRDLAAGLRALESLPDSGANAKARKGQFENVLRGARQVHLALDRTSSCEPDLPTEALGSCTSVAQWSISERMVSLLKTTSLIDAVNVRAADLLAPVAEARRSLAQATGDMHDPESDISWKANLAKDASLEAVLQTAQVEESLTSVNGTKVEEALKQLQEAVVVAHGCLVFEGCVSQVTMIYIFTVYLYHYNYNIIHIIYIYILCDATWNKIQYQYPYPHQIPYDDWGPLLSLLQSLCSFLAQNMCNQIGPAFGTGDRCL